jgi:hypothetical protein
MCVRESRRGNLDDVHAACLNESRTRGPVQCSEAGNPGTLLMNNEECGTAPPALDRLAMDPALPGWADFWCRPSGPGWQTPLSHVHSSLNLLQASRFLGMTKKRLTFLWKMVSEPKAFSSAWVGRNHSL